MSDLSSKTCLVFDRAEQHVPFALAMAKYFGRVLYFSEWRKAAPKHHDVITGSGFEEIQRVDSFFDHINQVDLFAFPFIYDGDLQEYLKEQGKLVWGSGRLENLEVDRSFFHDTIKEIGLDVPKQKVIVGISNLRSYLLDHEDLYIKTSKFRGSEGGETWPHTNYLQSEPIIDLMEYEAGPLKEKREFIVCEKIDSKIEAGGDFFETDGEVPEIVSHGFEAKDAAYVTTRCRYEDLPDPVREIQEAIAPVLKRGRYRGPLATEIKALDDKALWLDATCRWPSPPGEILSEWITNLGPVIYESAQGNVLQPDYSHEFACQIMLYSEWGATNWQPYQVDKDKERFLKLYAACKANGILYENPQTILPSPWPAREHMGSVLGFGDTLKDMVENVKENLASVKGFQSEDTLPALLDLFKEVKEAKKEGIDFTDDPLPEPESVLE